MSFRKNLIVAYTKSVFGVNTKHLRRRDFPGVSYDEFQKLKSLPFFLTEEGKAYINISDKNNMIFVNYFLAMSNSSTTSLIDALKEAEILYPDVIKPEGILNCADEQRQKEMGFKFMIPYELERRKRELENYKG